MSSIITRKGFKPVPSIEALWPHRRGNKRKGQISSTLLRVTVITSPLTAYANLASHGRLHSEWSVNDRTDTSRASRIAKACTNVIPAVDAWVRYD